MFLCSLQRWHIPSRRRGLTTKPVTGIRVQRLKMQNSHTKKKSSTDGVTLKLYNAVAKPMKDIRLDQVLLPSMQTMYPMPQIVQLWNPSSKIQYVNTMEKFQKEVYSHISYHPFHLQMLHQTSLQLLVISHLHSPHQDSFVVFIVHFRTGKHAFLTVFFLMPTSA